MGLCKLCGKLITSQSALLTGFGPVCAKKLKIDSSRFSVWETGSASQNLYRITTVLQHTKPPIEWVPGVVTQVAARELIPAGYQNWVYDRTVESLLDHMNFVEHVTPVLQEIFTNGTAAGRLDQLECRLKSPESLARKLKACHNTRNSSEGKLTVDVARYTVVAPLKNIVDTVQQVGETLARNYKLVKLEHSYNSPGYKDIRMVFQHPAMGNVFAEVQFHTDASLTAKKASHVFYKKMREDEVPVEAWLELKRKSDAMFTHVRTPRGLESIVVAGVPIAVKER